MDLGDILYYIVVAAFLILGIFNNIRKQKEKQTAPPIPPVAHTDFDEWDETPEWNHEMLPPAPAPPAEERWKPREFQSSVDLVADFGKETNYFADEEGIRSVFDDDGDDGGGEISQPLFAPVNPITEELRGDNMPRELRKAVLYSEILQRKY